MGITTEATETAEGVVVCLTAEQMDLAERIGKQRREYGKANCRDLHGLRFKDEADAILSDIESTAAEIALAVALGVGDCFCPPCQQSRTDPDILDKWGIPWQCRYTSHMDGCLLARSGEDRTHADHMYGLVTGGGGNYVVRGCLPATTVMSPWNWRELHPKRPACWAAPQKSLLPISWHLNIWSGTDLEPMK